MGRFAACGRKGRSCEPTCLVLPPGEPTSPAKPRGCLRVPGDLRVPSSMRGRRSADGPSAAPFNRIPGLAGLVGFPFSAQALGRRDLKGNPVHPANPVILSNRA